MMEEVFVEKDVDVQVKMVKLPWRIYDRADTVPKIHFSYIESHGLFPDSPSYFPSPASLNKQIFGSMPMFYYTHSV